MARPKRQDRDTVQDVALNLRVTAQERAALDRLREQQDAHMRSQGVVANITVAGVVRGLIHKACEEAFGAFPPPDPGAKKVDPRQLTIPGSDGRAVRRTGSHRRTGAVQRSVLAAVKANLQKNTGMAMVPAVVQAMGGDLTSAHQALLEADRAGLIELRPESGMGRLSQLEKKLCVPGLDGSLLSVVRMREVTK